MYFCFLDKAKGMWEIKDPRFIYRGEWWSIFKKVSGVSKNWAMQLKFQHKLYFTLGLKKKFVLQMSSPNYKWTARKGSLGPLEATNPSTDWFCFGCAPIFQIKLPPATVPLCPVWFLTEASLTYLQFWRNPSEQVYFHLVCSSTLAESMAISSVVLISPAKLCIGILTIYTYPFFKFYGSLKAKQTLRCGEKNWKGCFWVFFFRIILSWGSISVHLGEASITKFIPNLFFSTTDMI